MTNTITKGTGSIAPLAVLGYSASSTTGTITHTVIGSGTPSYTLGVESLRTGTLTLLFATAADAFAARTYLSTSSVYTFASTDQTNIGMKFVRVGDMSVDLDEASAKYFTLAVGFGEVI